MCIRDRPSNEPNTSTVGNLTFFILQCWLTFFYGVTYNSYRVCWYLKKMFTSLKRYTDFINHYYVTYNLKARLKWFLVCMCVLICHWSLVMEMWRQIIHSQYQHLDKWSLCTGCLNFVFALYFVSSEKVQNNFAGRGPWLYVHTNNAN